MSASLILRSPAIPTVASRPKATRDPLIRPGTKFLYDWYRPRTQPTGAIVPGAIPSATLIGRDLSPENVDAVAISNAFTTRADGAISNAGNANGLRIGTAGQFNMAAAPYEYVAIIWFSLPDPATSMNFSPLMRLSSTNAAGNAQLWFDMGAGGRQPRMGVMGTTYTTLTNIPLETPTQVAAHYDPGGAMNLYINGARIQGMTTGAPTVLTAAPSSVLEICANQLKTTYRASLCDIDVSVAAEQAAGYSADAILTGPQMIAQDYAFCMDQIAAAPKAVFVG